jgi:dTDP-glucose pyrophosphorylase
MLGRVLPTPFNEYRGADKVVYPTSQTLYCSKISQHYNPIKIRKPCNRPFVIRYTIPVSKSRLTITLSTDILNQIEHQIDGKHVRNRSHAIEKFLIQQLRGNISQAVILAGGNKQASKRLLTPISGQPLILHLYHLLTSYHISRIILLSDLPPSSVQPIIDLVPKVILVHQPPNLGTAGSLRHAQTKFSAKPILVLHGDIFTDINLADVIDFHQRQKSLATICVKPKLNQKEFGKVIMHGNQVTKFLSNPKESAVGMINTGVYILNPSVIDMIPANIPSMLETDIFPQLVNQHQLSAFVYEGIWYDVSPDRLLAK